MIIEEKELKNPYGAYRIKIFESPATECGTLENEEQFVTLLANIREMDTVELFTISRFVDGEIKIIHVIDNGPKVDADMEAQDHDVFGDDKI